MNAPPVLAVDLGKTSCRVRLSVDGSVIAEAAAHGAPGLAEEDGAMRSFTAVVDAVGLLSTAPPAGCAVGVGAAGSEAAPAAARALIGLLRERFNGPVAVINDALAAHAGAFEGAPGTMLIAGTGAVVFAVDEAGAVRQVDGWGPWLGDEGSGQWLGRHGLVAALRAHDDRGPHTALLADAAALTGTGALTGAAAPTDAAAALTAGAASGSGVASLPHWVSESGTPARQLGRFAPTVIERASEGDAVAVELVERAAAHLADSCAAAGQPIVCVAGGLVSHPFFADRVSAALHAHGLRETVQKGDPLAGAALIAVERSLPYEERIIRG